MVKKIRSHFNCLVQSVFVGLTFSMLTGITSPTNAAEKVVFSMNTQTISLQAHLEKVKQETEIDLDIDLNSLSNAELEGDYEIEVADLDRLVRGEEPSPALQNYFNKVEQWKNYLETEISGKIDNGQQSSLEENINGIDVQIQDIKNNPQFSPESIDSIVHMLEEEKNEKLEELENIRSQSQKLRAAIQNELQDKLGDPSRKLKEELNRSISGGQNNSEQEDNTFLSQLMNVSDLERKDFRNLMTQFKGVNTLKFLQDFPETIITRDNFLNCLKVCNFDKQDNSDPKDEPKNDLGEPREQAKQKKFNVLWYGQGDRYDSKITTLANFASEYDPWDDGSLDWNLTIWNPLDDAPTFSNYDVFVIGSAFKIPHHGFNFNSVGLFNYKKEIEKARGERTVLTGLDADAHYILPHRGQNPNLPKNFLINAVNWAGSGEGLGIVSLTDGIQGSRWWLNENSFLKDELEGYLTYSNRNDIGILDEMLDFPIHEGLTAANLSNWRTSNHIQFAGDLPDYCSVNHLEKNPEKSTTVMSGNCNKTIPEPSVTLGLLTLGLMSFGSLVKRQKS